MIVFYNSALNFISQNTLNYFCRENKFKCRKKSKWEFVQYTQEQLNQVKELFESSREIIQTPDLKDQVSDLLLPLGSYTQNVVNKVLGVGKVDEFQFVQSSEVLALFIHDGILLHPDYQFKRLKEVLLAMMRKENRILKAFLNRTK